MTFGTLLRFREIGPWKHANYKLSPDYIDDSAIGLSVTIIEKDETGWEEFKRGVLVSYDVNGFKVKSTEGKGKKVVEVKWGTPGFVFSYIDSENKIVNDLEDLELQEEELHRKREALNNQTIKPVKTESDTVKDKPSKPLPKKRKTRSDKGKKRGPRKQNK